MLFEDLQDKGPRLCDGILKLRHLLRRREDLRYLFFPHGILRAISLT